MKKTENDNKSKSSESKKHWVQPTLSVLGDISKITKGAAAGVSDSGGLSAFTS